MTLERNFAFAEEGCCGVLPGFADGFALAEGPCFGEAEPEDYDEDGWAGAEPEKLGVVRESVGGWGERLTGRQP